MKTALSKLEYESSNKNPRLQNKYTLGEKTKETLFQELRGAWNGENDLSPVELVDAIQTKDNELCSINDEILQEKNRNRKRTLTSMDQELFDDALKETAMEKYGNARRLFGILETGRDMQNSLETKKGQIESFIGKFPRPNNINRLSFVCLYKINGRFCNVKRNQKPLMIKHVETHINLQ